MNIVFPSDFIRYCLILNVDMSEEGKFPSSPLYQAKVVLFALRWFCFGFPLKPTNGDLNQFIFNELVEYGKYTCFTFLNITVLCWQAYVGLKVTKLSNPFRAQEALQNDFGIFGLDRIIQMAFPAMSYASNHFYFLSFKNNIKGINNALIYLCSIKEFSRFRAKKSAEPAKNMEKLRLYKYLMLLFCLTLLTTGMMTSFYFSLFIGAHAKELTKTDMIFTFLAFSYGIWNMIYPGMAFSADLLVCTLSEDATKSFEQFSSLLEQKNTFFPNRPVHMQWVNPKSQDVSTRSFLHGYGMIFIFHNI